MTLREFLQKTSQSIAAFSACSGVNKVCLSLYLSGKRGVSLTTAAKIVRATGGQVSFEDLLPPQARDNSMVNDKINGAVQK